MHQGNSKILGIRRGSEFSPNHTGNDNAIFSRVTEFLTQKGLHIRICSETEFCEQNIETSVVYGMPRDKQTILKLKLYEQRGVPVFNSAYGIEKCYRSNMTRVLMEKGVPYPNSRIVPTGKEANEAFENLGGKNFWIKRGDFHAIHKEDVSFVHNIEEGNMLLNEFSLRGIHEAVISEHLYGDLVKFYGVRGTDFFYWFYPYDVNHSKFGHESINGAAHYFPFQEIDLKDISNKAAEALDVYIYGGDAIISKDGSIRVIDLNDWPSFAPCREQAAESIAECLFNLINTK